MTEKRSRGRPRAFNDKTEQNTIQALDRAMMILEELAGFEGLTLSDVAERLSQSPATVYRVLVTLEGRGITEMDPVSQTWMVGPKAFLIGSSFLRRTSVVERARPYMRELMQATGETANLGVERGTHVMFVSQVETHASIRAFFPPGTLSPLHASGIGKALLAHADADRLDEFLKAGPLEGFTPHTITNPDNLRVDLSAIRSRGYALDNEERASGMRCVAAPVFNALGEAVAGLSVSGPVSRMTEGRAKSVGWVVTKAARDLSINLGAPET
ncbi:HTH-type transcriptional regulator BhcR [Actibacterium sp. 188UL27-1]|uniref:HTH-type transcriptional regulator BhcR n=1 Tax=Actibacterium sp. 188UL27-1 TaxID=2786961 RepID=UPI00195BF87B|nr:HTH-type transcriptional regulator BhcR [Actibacterium sp. 188UL27-1]MBM7068374.1 IclR family transcriptional regulator [Actibacterium sp. 188UL27-1]